MNIGIFAIDPGGSTGVAWSIINPRSRTTVDAMNGRIHPGSTTITGEAAIQARRLYQEWMKFKNYCVHEALLPPENVRLVVEDFVLRAGPHAGGRDGTSPERVAYCFEGYRMGRLDQHLRSHKNYHYTPIVWQQPSSAARHKARDRLKAYDAWVVGKEHERSAYSHMALYISGILR